MGEAFIALGNTRRELPVKIGCPNVSRVKRIISSGPKARIIGSSGAADGP